MKHVYNLPRGHSRIDPFRPFFCLTLFLPFNLSLPKLTHATLQHFKLAAPVRQNWRFSSPLSTLLTPLFLILLCWVVLALATTDNCAHLQAAATNVTALVPISQCRHCLDAPASFLQCAILLRTGW